MEDGGPQPPLSIIEFEEWSAFFKMKKENMDKTLQQRSGKKGTGRRRSLEPDEDPPTMGSRSKSR